MCGSKEFTPGCDGTLTLELTLETAPGETADAADHHQLPLTLTLEHAAGCYPIVLQVAAAAHPTLQVSIRAELALDAPRPLNQRRMEAMGRIDDAINVWGADTHRSACAPLQTPSPGAISDLPAAVEATTSSLGGESAPPEQHSRHRIQRGPGTRVAESARPVFRTGLRSVLTGPWRVPAGVLVVPLALLLFLLTITADSITALTVVPLWVVLPPLVLLLLLLVFAQQGRLTGRPAVPVWTLLVPVLLLLLLLGLARTSTAGGHPSEHRAAAVRSSHAFAPVISCSDHPAATVTRRKPPGGQARALLRDRPRLRQVRRDG
jgi:hypothetical protein